MSNIIIILIIATAVISAICYIVKEKKKGRCIGCPNASKCGGACQGAWKEDIHTDKEVK